MVVHFLPKFSCMTISLAYEGESHSIGSHVPQGTGTLVTCRTHPWGRRKKYPKVIECRCHGKVKFGLRYMHSPQGFWAVHGNCDSLIPRRFRQGIGTPPPEARDHYQLVKVMHHKEPLEGKLESTGGGGGGSHKFLLNPAGQWHIFLNIFGKSV